MSSSSDLPPSNPILTAAEAWQERTPLVTRYLIMIQGITYVISWIFNYSFALSNIPQFTVAKWELYRVFLSPLVNTSIFSFIFAIMSFSDLGKRLEFSLGSSSYGWMCTFFGITANGLFLVACLVMSFVDPTWMLSSASGMWSIFFGILAVECSHAPPDLQIRLCFFNVPVPFYPLALHLLFSIMGGGSFIVNSFSLLLGYAVGQGYIDSPARLSSSRAKQWEDTILSSITRRPGWVYGHAATGMDSDWNDTGVGTMMMPLFRTNADTDASNSHSSTGNRSRSNAASLFGVDAGDGGGADPLPITSGGQTLGGATRRGNADPRTARIQALDKKAQVAEP